MSRPAFQSGKWSWWRLLLLLLLLTDVSGNVTDVYDYDAFGNLIQQGGNTPNLYLYAGEQFDPDLQLYYLRARYLNPDTGRFWTRDPFEGFLDDPASLNGYL